MNDDDFVSSVLSCVNINMDWPDINLSGFPSICIGCFRSMFAGLNLVLPFLPPDPDNLPSFSIPDIDIFIDAFFNGIALPSFPAIVFNFSGISIIIPDFDGINLPKTPDFYWFNGVSFDPVAMCKLIALMIGIPFFAIKFIIDSIFNLSLEIPDFNFFYDLIFEIGLSVEIGFSVPSLELFAGCLATALAALLEEFLG